jgi:large subunit ribosomal protein L29
MVKAKELDELDAEELEARLVEAKAEVFNLRFQHVTGQLDNYARLGQLRHDLARIMTVMRAREIQAAEEEQVQ